MKRLAAAVLCAAVGAALAGPGAHGPDGEHLDAPAVQAVGGLARLPDGSVNLPMRAQRRLGIRTVLAVQSAAAATVELPGRVVADPNASGRIQTTIAGRVEPGPRGLPVAGQPVRRGEVLGYIVHRPDPLALGSQQALLADLKAERGVAELKLQRLASLEGTVPRKEIEAARSALQSLAERERSIRASLVAREPLVAPISGVVARMDAAIGQVVGPREVLFEVVDPARVLVDASAQDAQLAARLGEATLAGTPGWRLRLLGVGPALREGTVPLTFKAVGDAAPALAIGQPVTVLATLDERVQGYVLPAQAITRSPANEPVLWIKASAERYLPQPVRYRALDAHRVVVTQGLGADNRVVVQGAALIAQIR